MRNVLIIILSLICSSNLFTQTPHSFTNDCPISIKNMEINQVLFPALNNDSIYKSMQRGLVYPSAKILLAEIDIENNGT